MGIASPTSHLTTEISASVHEAAEAFVVLWTRTASGVAHEVSAPQLRALLSIAHSGTTNLTHLADSMGAMLSSASRLCERLVTAGLVERRASPANRRELQLALTREGEHLLARLEDQRREALTDVLEKMNPAAQSALLSGLESFADAASPQGTTAGHQRAL